MPSSTVGTPAVTVTRSPWMSAATSRGVGCTPGYTCAAPTMVALKGSPQALAWNIGTTDSTTSRSIKPKASAMHCA